MTISEERRLVTVLFVDLVGFTSRSESSDPEEVRDIQRAYFEAVAAEVQRYGGTVEKYIGDAVMAIYGAPQAHDDDAERALHAALAIREAVRQQDLEVRIGVNTGEVVGGAGSGPQAHEYTVTGDAVNVAARLQQAAEPDGILVGATTRRLAANAFEFATLEPLELKGKAEPMEVWRLDRAAAERRLARGGEAPLVGRSRELRLLEGALAEAADGHGLLIGLSGEAGIGKSRLALEIRARAEADGFATTWAGAPSYASAFPYHLVGQLAAQLGIEREEIDAAAPDDEARDLWTAALDDLGGSATAEERAVLRDASPARRQRLLVQALGAVLRGRVAGRPQLLVLDDLHWADASSIAVLDELLGLVPDHPLAVLLLYRPGWENPWAGRSYYQQVNLGGLRTTDAEELVRALSPDRAVSDAQTAELLHRSGGNPFFLEELLRSRGTDANGAAQRLPETVHELLLARIDALTPEARATLQVAAVSGMHFTERLLAAVEPDLDVEAALGELTRGDLVVHSGGSADDQGFVMRHPLVHEVAYRSLLLARRRELHRRIGAWLEEHGGEDALAEVAAHYRDGADLDRARELLPRAADRAARLNAQREAIEAYLQAADLFEGEPQRRAEMLEGAAAQSFISGTLQDAIAFISEARDLYERAGNRVLALNARRLRGRYYWLDGRGVEAEAEIDAAVEGLEALSPSGELALAYSYRSQLAFLSPDYPLGERLARKAIAVAEQVGSFEAMTHALNNLGMCRSGMGDPGGIDDVHRSLALSLEHNLIDDAARAYTNLSGQGAAISVFPYDEAEALYEEMFAFDQRTAPGGNYEQWHHAGRAELWIAAGRWDDADRLLRELMARGAANRYMDLDVAVFLGLLVAFRGRYDEAVSLARPHVEVAVQIGDLQAYGPTFIVLAHAEAGHGDTAASLAAIERFIEVRGDTHEHNVSSWALFEMVDVATWLRRRADPDVADRAVGALRRFARHLEPDVERGGTPPEVAVRSALYGAAALQLRLLAGEADADAAAFSTFAGSLRGEHRVFDAARIELWLAEATGADAGSEARATFEELRATPYLERSRA